MNRIESVERIRVIAVFAVIVLHTTPFQSPQAAVGAYFLAGIVIKQLATFAVPFFFIVSGFFWGRKVRRSGQIKAASLPQCKRLLTIFLFWSAVYLLPYNLASVVDYGPSGPFKIAFWHMKELASRPAMLLFEGTKGPLWFLIALVCAIAITSCFVYMNNVAALVVIALGLYTAGLLADGYAMTPVGIKVDFNPRSGPAYSTIFFVLGYLLSKFTPTRAWYCYGWLTAAAGIIIKAAEILFLWRAYQTGLFKDYLAGTVPMGLGAALVALSGQHAPAPGSAGLSRYGRHVLGIYLIHMIYIDNLSSLDAAFQHSAAWEAGFPIMVMGLSLLTAWALSKNDFFRRYLQ